MSKRSTTERLTQRYRNKETYIWFLLTWKRLIIHAIQNKYEVVTTSMRTPSGEIKDYPIETGLHHGLRLESLLSWMLIKDIQKIIPNCLHFVDDIILIEESREAINIKLELWRQTLETKVISQLSKFKYLGSIIQNDGKNNEDVIQVGWLKWRKALRVICDHKG
ncbi:hypothetical protein HKD37_14G038851 [Glycine soja]